MTDKEQYICLNCYAVGYLNQQLRCSSCDNDAVASVEQIKQKAKPIHDMIFHKEVKTQRRPLVWYNIHWGPFETVVPYTKASSYEEALAYAMSPEKDCEWYVVERPVGERNDMSGPEGILLDHNGFNLWCRKRWPLSDALSTKESITSGDASKPMT